VRVWLLTVGEPLPIFDGGSPRLFRTGLLAGVLRARGHEVTWWTSAFDHYGKRHRVDADTAATWEGGEIRLLRSVGYRRNLSLSRFVEHTGVARKFAKQARSRPPPDVILASLPTIELAHRAVRFGLANDVPVIVDIRDLWPDVLLNVLPRSIRWTGRIALHWLMVKARFVLQRCSGIVGISDDYLDWGLRLADRKKGPLDAVFSMGYVRRSAELHIDSGVRDRLTELGVDEGRRICWYVGSFGRTYDLAPVMFAARSLEEDGRDDIQFVISGEGELGPRWRDLAKGLTNVVFTGWIGADEIEWLKRRASIGLQPYAAGAPQGLANKLFEYMSAGIPLVSSLKGENEALLANHECGVTYRAGDGQECLEKLLSLLDNEDLRREMGLRAAAAFHEGFDGEMVLDALADHLEMLAARTRSVSRPRPEAERG
jgi:glycosyltransferase involved in cell wall biosynthesis